jgi:hypothetical protein
MVVVVVFIRLRKVTRGYIMLHEVTVAYWDKRDTSHVGQEGHIPRAGIGVKGTHPTWSKRDTSHGLEEVKLESCRAVWLKNDRDFDETLK